MFGMGGNVGAVEWSVGKLMSIVLLVVVLALVVYGVSSGSLIPLHERVAGMFDEVILFFTNWGVGGGDGEVECYDRMVVDISGGEELLNVLDVEGVNRGGAFLRSCSGEGECRLVTVGGGVYWLSLSKRFGYEGIGDSWNKEKDYLFDSSDLDEVELYWDLYNVGIDSLMKDVGVDYLRGFYNNRFTKSFVLYDKGGWLDDDVYATWGDGKWIIYRKGDKILYEGENDNEALGIFYGQADDKVADDVYYKISFSSSMTSIGDVSDFGGEGIVNIIGGEDNKITSDGELVILKEKFVGIKQNLLDEAVPSSADIENLDVKISGRTFFIGDDEYVVGLDRSEGIPIITFSFGNKVYGLKFSSDALLYHSKLKTRPVSNDYSVATNDFVKLKNDLSFVLVSKSDGEWVVIGEEEEYKLPEDYFLTALKINKALDFIRFKC